MILKSYEESLDCDQITADASKEKTLNLMDNVRVNKHNFSAFRC